MNCHRAQPVLSARMDGEAVPRGAATAADAHAASCPACTAFLERSARVRTAVRIRPAMTVPDLVEPIVAAAASERMRPTRLAGRGSRRSVRLGGPLRIVAAAIVGLVVGSVAVGGPWLAADEQPVAVATIAEHLRTAAGSLESYSATYTIVERGLSDEVPERRFEMDVAFREPQRFRMDVRDLTEYPTDDWTATDLTAIEDVPLSYREAPEPCLVVLRSCPPTRTVAIRASSFSGATPLAADLIVPLATFGTTDGIRVAGTDEIDGRPAVHAVLSFQRAAPLFPFLDAGGTWRPFFAGDRVDLWLDAATWFPVRYMVTPSPADARRAWEMRFGRGIEPAGTPILEVDARIVRTEAPDVSRFAIPRIDDPEVRPEILADRLGYVPVTPAETVDLELVSASMPGDGDDATPRSLLVYADGLDYLRIAEHPDWSGPGPFGPVGPDAERVELRSGVGRFAPSGDGFGNRLAIHADDTDLYLESNLPRDELLAVATSLPIQGIPLEDDP